MIKTEITKEEINSRINGVGDYVKMQILSSALKKRLDFDTKKFVYGKLAQVYESRRMFAEAAKMMNNSAEINSTYEDRMKDFMKASDLYVRSGYFDEGDVSFSKALNCVPEHRRRRLRDERKESYKAVAQDYLAKDKRSQAMKAYEKLLTFELSPNERKEVQSQLLYLYERLGKIREFYAMKANLD